MSEPATGATLSITVNGGEREVDPGTSVADLLELLDLKPGMVVVERNREILARDAYPSVQLEAGDRLELVHFVGGG
jgi:sulfur carrier protein